ncbi:hypothetical protein BCV69DRAFT_282594 [Microstroma glucosiphilum]|uniref:Uncharacterized protein n=1 Tax=Pseudomicrostroma glucosiphilum TaxID=1684307 RepID=A0A316U788_9BASI|nr:hypothetical protein BCV69DRAFT_282594 [Pseudomicrostroma glucosiphilum]PWN21097.1 hypothetical protein BCV69DRAFT_282594 [Pseudomicrostroma glucosiphilum]
MNGTATSANAPTAASSSSSTAHHAAPSSSSSSAHFNLPPAVDFDAIRRRQRAALQGIGPGLPPGASSGRDSQRASPSASRNPSADHFQDALSQFMESNRQMMANQAGFSSISSNNHLSSRSSPHLSTQSHTHMPGYPMLQQATSNSQHNNLSGLDSGREHRTEHHYPQLHNHFYPQQHDRSNHIQALPQPPGQASGAVTDPHHHARLLSSASHSLNTFSLDMSRAHTTAMGLTSPDADLLSCLSTVKAAAQTLCTDLHTISAALRSLPPLPTLSQDPSASNNGPHTALSTYPWQASMPPDLAAMYAQLQGHQSGNNNSPGISSSNDDTPNHHSNRIEADASATNTPNQAVEPSLLLSLLNGEGLPPGPAEQMLDFLNAGSSSSANQAGVRASAGPQRIHSGANDGDDSPPDPSRPGSSKAPVISSKGGLIKHKSRPPIEGVRRESVRYRNRKLLVDMREQLYKWLDTTEFCRIAKSYPNGRNGWITVPINAEKPMEGTRRVFQPNFEIGSDLYIANKELLEELIELGVQKVEEKPEAYGMKEGVNAKDVVVDVAKDLMDSARHGYRANLKKQQEDEADAKAKSTRYKQQERHRTKVRNREVGAKRLKHPIPDALLTMGLHSDDAASDQEEMHNMDKEEWRKLRVRKLQSKRGWEALAPKWRNRHLTKAYHIADTLSKSKQMPRWRRDGGVDLELPVRLWGKTLPKCIFDPAWLRENETKIKAEPYNVTVNEAGVADWDDDDHRLTDDTEDELERYEREQTRLSRAARKKSVMANQDDPSSLRPHHRFPSASSSLGGARTPEDETFIPTHLSHKRMRIEQT